MHKPIKYVEKAVTVAAASLPCGTAIVALCVLGEGAATMCEAHCEP